MRHLGYFWPNYKHYYGTASPLSMGKCCWFSFLQKTVFFLSKTHNSQNKILAVKNLGNSDHTSVFGGAFHWIHGRLKTNYILNTKRQPFKKKKRLYGLLKNVNKTSDFPIEIHIFCYVCSNVYVFYYNASPIKF